MAFFLNLDVIKNTDTNYAAILKKSVERVRINQVHDNVNFSGTGKTFTAEFEVIGGPFAGYKIWEFYCYEHINRSTRNFAWKRIRSLVIAIFGDDSSRNLDEFTGKTLLVETKFEHFDGMDFTKIAKYYQDHSSITSDKISSKSK